MSTTINIFISLKIGVLVISKEKQIIRLVTFFIVALTAQKIIFLTFMY
jgi:hypothetical protein